MSDNEPSDQFIHDDHIDYDHLITASMHWLVRTTLAEVAKKGFPEEHHLYISFDTTDPEVHIPDNLRARYPQEMMIVLQNRFYDLVVNEREFSVSLSFSRVLERLTIPFHALTRFYDPSCGFVLQLGNWDEEGEQSLEVLEHAIEQDQSKEKDTKTAKPDAETEIPATEESHDENGDQDNVVSLDRFRKK